MRRRPSPPTTRIWPLSSTSPTSLVRRRKDILDDGAAAAFYASQGVAMTFESAPEVKSIMPVSWLGPNVFHVTSTCEVAVLMRLDYRGWHACSSKEEVFDGGAGVARGSADLLEDA